jgi:hypothetical protein
MDFFAWLVDEVKAGRMSVEEAEARFQRHHDEYQSQRKAGNRTFNPRMKVRHRFGEGQKRDHSTKLKKPGIWGRMQKYGV